MPSSTSSSNDAILEREVPDRPWLGLMLVGALVALAALAAWEMKVRAWGYVPTIADRPTFWASKRAMAVGAKRDQLVFVGSSRTLFDIDLPTFRVATGGPRPIQLATVGSNPLPIFTHVANDTSYAGTTIVGIVPGLLAAGGGPPLATPKRYVAKYDRWSPSDGWELPLTLFLQQRVALLGPSDVALVPLLRDTLKLNNRPHVYAPDTPPSMFTLDRERQGRLQEHLAREPDRMKRIQQIWIPLFGDVPRPPIFSAEQWAQMMEDALQANLTQAAHNVAAIEKRGGRVIFVRFPSSGRVRELERERMPRDKVWEPLLERSGAPGIHFEDHEELRGFDCPEWSHLSVEDAVTFSRGLVAVMKRQGLL